MTCTGCGVENPMGAKFCMACGTSLAASPVPAAYTPNQTGASRDFVGRQAELQQLIALLEGVCAGQGRLVMLVGEPGIGKTRLAQELSSIAEYRGVRVAWGRCYEEQGVPPYWPWVQPLRDYVQSTSPDALLSQMGSGAADIAEIVPDVRNKLPDLEHPPSLEPEQSRFRLFDSLTTFLKNSARLQPLLLVLDDLHWADRSSLLLLEFVARELQRSRIMVLGTYRDVELSRQHPLAETLGELTRGQLFQRMLLRRWGHEDVANFIERFGGSERSPGLTQAVYSQTEGNPLFVAEMVRLLDQEGDSSIGEFSPQGNWRLRLPEGIREVIGRRLNRLSHECNDALTVASVIGREFTLEQLGHLVGTVTEEQLFEALEEALASRIIEELPRGVGSYQFTHALIQETLLEELSLTRRVRLHAQIAEILEQLYDDNVEAHAAELAHHFGQAEAILGPGKAASYCLLAGEQALASYAWEEALQHFRRGLAANETSLDSTEPAGDAETAALLFGLVRAQVPAVSGSSFQQSAEVVATLTRAFDFYEASGDVDKAVAVAEYRLISTGVESGAGDSLIKRGLALVAPDSHSAGRLLSQRIRILGVYQRNYSAAREAAERALAIARRERDDSLELWVLANFGSLELQHAHYREVVQRCEQALSLAQRRDDPQSELLARQNWHIATQIIGEGPSVAAQHNANAMQRLAQRLQDRFRLVSVHWITATLAYQKGDRDEAQRLVGQALAVASDDARAVALGMAIGYLWGESAQGDAHLERLLEIMRLSDAGLTRVFSPLGVALAGYLEGDTSRLTEAEALAHSVLAPGAILHQVIPLQIALSLIAIQRGNLAQCLEQYQALEPHRGIMVVGSTLTLTDRVLGLLARTLGNLDTAGEHFEDALTYLQKQGNLPELAWTCYEYADLLLQRNGPGDHTRALALLEESLAISTQLGMRPLMGRVAGLQELAHSQPSRVPRYPDGLSQREVEVLRLIAAGRTDREIAGELIISSRTVNNHVRSILNKTAVANRTEAAAYAVVHGLM